MASLPTCPRCSRRLFLELEPDYGTCLVHGSQYIGKPFQPMPEGRPAPKKVSKLRAKGVARE